MRTISQCLVAILFLVTVSVSERGTWNPNGNLEYYVSKPAIYWDTFDEAENSCRSQNGTVALVKTKAVQDFIESLVEDKKFSGYPYAFFIGLRKVNTIYVWNDGEDLVFSNWGSNEPTINNNEKCVVMGLTEFNYTADMKWNNVDCDNHLKPYGQVCERLIGLNWGSWGAWEDCTCTGFIQRSRSCVDSGRAGPSSCADGDSIQNKTCVHPPECNVTTPATTTAAPIFGRGKWLAHGAYQYYVSDESEGKDYGHSQAFCRKNDGELAIVKSQSIQSFIASIVTADSAKKMPYGFYIGLRYDETMKKYLWTDGSEVGSFEPWAPGEPNNKNNEEKCVAMGQIYTYTKELKWHDYQCIIGSSGKKGLVCQRRIGKYWGTWSLFSGCSCSLTSETRNRTCRNSGRSGPDKCIGSANETRPCLFDPACVTEAIAVTTSPSSPTTSAQKTTDTVNVPTSTLPQTSRAEAKDHSTPVNLTPTTVVSTSTLTAKATTSNDETTPLFTTPIATTALAQGTTPTTLSSTSAAVETLPGSLIDQSTIANLLPITEFSLSTSADETTVPEVATTLSFTVPILTTTNKQETTKEIRILASAVTETLPRTMSKEQSATGNPLPVTELPISTSAGNPAIIDAATTATPTTASIQTSGFLETLSAAAMEKATLFTPLPTTTLPLSSLVSETTILNKTATVIPIVATATSISANETAATALIYPETSPITVTEQSTLSNAPPVTSASWVTTVGQTVTETTAAAAAASAGTSTFAYAPTTSLGVEIATTSDDSVTATTNLYLTPKIEPKTNSSAVTETSGWNERTTLREITSIDFSQSTAAATETEITVIGTTKTMKKTTKPPVSQESTKMLTTNGVMTDSTESVVSTDGTTVESPAEPPPKSSPIVIPVVGATGGLLLLAIIGFAAVMIFRHRRRTGGAGFSGHRNEAKIRESDRGNLFDDERAVAMIDFSGTVESGPDAQDVIINEAFETDNKNSNQNCPDDSDLLRQEDIPGTSRSGSSVVDEGKSREINSSNGFTGDDGAVPVKPNYIVINDDAYATIVKKQGSDSSSFSSKNARNESEVVLSI